MTQSNNSTANSFPWITRTRQTFLSALDRGAAALNSHPWMLVGLIFLLYIRIVAHLEHSPLWNDELYTLYIAQAPSLKDMFLWIQQVDLNPPLYYAAARATLHVLHPVKLALRLPSIVAYFAAVLCAYRFVRYRFSPLYASIACFILLGTGYRYYASEARPYALVLGFLGLAGIGWQSAAGGTGRKRMLGLLLIVAGGFGMLLSHVLALVAYASFFLAELVRFTIRKKADWALWVSLLIPLSSCLLYFPLIQNHAGGVYAPALQSSIQDLFDNYSKLWMDTAPYLAAAMVLAAYFGLQRPPQTGNRPKLETFLPELAFASGLLLMPLIVVLRFMHSHSAYYQRYGIPAVFGCAIVIPYFLAWWIDESRRGALVAAIVFLVSVVQPSALARVLQAHLQPSSDRVSQRREIRTALDQIQPDLPFVVTDSRTFLEMDYRESGAFLKRVYYLVDPEAAIAYSHENGGNGMLSLHEVFPIRANAELFRDFVKVHPRFIVFGSYDYPGDWLIPKLLADGDIVRFLGVIPSKYRDNHLYEVTIVPKSAQ